MAEYDVKDEIQMNYKVDNAVIMAAGISSRFVPISIESPKALLRVKGEILIERQIKQLREAGIGQIIVVTGYKKEQFEYLRERFGVILIENTEYDSRNNHSSLFAARDYIRNTYICSADNYFVHNPFTAWNHESYYAAVYVEGRTEEWCLSENEKGYITKVDIGGHDAWIMMGHAFFTEEFSRKFLFILEEEYEKPETRNKLWETIFTEHLDKLPMKIQKYNSGDIYEFDTLDELRRFDGEYLEHSGSVLMQKIATKNGCSESRIRRIRPVYNEKGELVGMRFLCAEEPKEYYFQEQVPAFRDIALLAKVLKVAENEVKQIGTLKTGMTNHSFLFECYQKKYIIRIPGAGTESMINRVGEAAVYNIIRDRQIGDPVIYIDPYRGYKISEYMEGARVCNPQSEEDVAKCMKLLRDFHEMRLVTKNEFDLFAQIDLYESLWNGSASVYGDYDKTKRDVWSLKDYLGKQHIEKTLTHIDAVCDNFLLYQSSNGKEGVRLIDWEYAGMQDPHVDIAMFCIYAGYEKAQIDKTINLYFQDDEERSVVIKIYCYIAICGLLWSNWCEYKRKLGVEFGEYALRQYQYAKDYCTIVRDILADKDVVGYK